MCRKSVQKGSLRNRESRYSHSANVVVLYVIMVCSHEHDVDDDAEGDEELGEWIEDDVGEELTDLDPDGAAVPDAEHVGRVHALLNQHLLQLLALVLIIVVVVVLRKKERSCERNKCFGRQRRAKGFPGPSQFLVK